MQKKIMMMKYSVSCYGLLQVFVVINKLIMYFVILYVHILNTTYG